MSDGDNFDKYDKYNFEQDKYEHSGSGKHRSKKEAAEHTNHHNPGGHERKIVTKLVNTEKNQNAAANKSGSSPPK